MSTSHTVSVALASQTEAILLVGPGLIGCGVNLIFYGVALSNSVDYVTSPLFRADSPRLKTLLAVVFLLATLQSGLVF